MIQRDWILWFGAGGGSCGGMMGACLGRKGKNAMVENELGLSEIGMRLR